MNWVYPDAPMEISEAMLAILNAEPHGTWLALPKYNGHRHILRRSPYTMQYQHFTKRGLVLKHVHPEISEALNRLNIPPEVSFDCELVGPRHKGMPHRLHIFDILTTQTGEWCVLPYWQRLDMLLRLGEALDIREYSTPVSFMCPYSLLSLKAQFEREKLNPLSEGLVIRHRNQQNVGGLRGQAESPLFLKCKFKKGGSEDGE